MDKLLFKPIIKKIILNSKDTEIVDYPPSSWWGVNNPDADEMSMYPTLKLFFTSDDIQERYWINECWNELEEKGINWREEPEYLIQLEKEAKIIRKIISEKY